MTNDMTARTDQSITRRRLVAASGAALAVGLAGCTEIGLGGEGGEEGENSEGGEGGGGEQEGGGGGGEQEGGEQGGGGEQEDGDGEQED